MALNDNDLFLVNQGGVSKKITYENLKINLNEDDALWELAGNDIQPKNGNHNIKVGAGKTALISDGSAKFAEDKFHIERTG